MNAPTEQVRLARIALNRLGPIARSNERDRRPTQAELDQIIATADANLRQIIPLGRLVKFAVATAMQHHGRYRAYRVIDRMLRLNRSVSEAPREPDEHC